MSGREGGRHLSGQQGGTTASLCHTRLPRGGKQRLGKVENISLANFIMMQAFNKYISVSQGCQGGEKEEEEVLGKEGEG